MAEHIDYSELDARYGKKGATNAALTTGIIGTAGLLLNGGLGNIFGGGSNSTANGLCAVPSMWEICEKQNKENVALTSAIYQARIREMEDLANVYERVNVRLVELEKKDAALTASLPLAMQLATVNAERYADNKVFAETQNRERMDFFLQNEISKKIDGQMGLPWSSIISGIPVMPQCTMDVHCPKSV